MSEYHQGVIMGMVYGVSAVAIVTALLTLLEIRRRSRAPSDRATANRQEG